MNSKTAKSGLHQVGKLYFNFKCLSTFFRLRIERSDVLDNNNHLLVTIIDIYQVLHFRLMCLTGELSDVQSNHLIMPPPRR